MAFNKTYSTILKCCSHSMLGMEFLNLNDAGDMAQRLMHNQDKFIPCLDGQTNKTIIIEHVPLHGDHRFEERARNTAWTFINGITEFERLEGSQHEHACDWHAKLTLCKFCLHSVQNKDIFYQLHHFVAY